MTETLPSTEYRSTRLVVVAWYFQITGILGLVAVGGTLAAGALGHQATRHALTEHPFGLALSAIQVASWLLAGRTLWNRKLSGAVMALANFIPPVASALLGLPLGIQSLVVSAIGLVATISILPELRRSSA